MGGSVRNNSNNDNDNNSWRASEASETLSGVTQLKIGDVCLYICGDVRSYVICALTFAYFCVSSVVDPVTGSAG